jgi:hypothetical protein
MAKNAFRVPLDFELFSQKETEQILHCAQNKRVELIRAGKLVVINVGGKNLTTGKSLRDYIHDCAVNPQQSGRSLCAASLYRRGAKRLSKAAS